MPLKGRTKDSSSSALPAATGDALPLEIPEDLETPHYDALSTQRQRFVDEYLACFNAVRAAKAANYSEASAHSTGSILLRDVRIREAIEERRKILEKTTWVSVERVVQELALIAFHDPAEFFDGKGKLRDLTDAEMRCVAGIARRPSKYGEIVEVKMYSKLDALDKLCRILGAYKDKTEVSGTVGGVMTLKWAESVNEMKEALDWLK